MGNAAVDLFKSSRHYVSLSDIHFDGCLSSVVEFVSPVCFVLLRPSVVPDMHRWIQQGVFLWGLKWLKLCNNLKSESLQTSVRIGAFLLYNTVFFLFSICVIMQLVRRNEDWSKVQIPWSTLLKYFFLHTSYIRGTNIQTKKKQQACWLQKSAVTSWVQ